MHIQNITLKELLDIAQGEGDPRSTNAQQRDYISRAAEAVGPLKAVWQQSDNELQSFPVAIVLDKVRHRNFLAWAITYLPQLRPFTAFCRVLAPKTIDEYLRRERQVPTLGLFEEAWLGLILGELAMLTGGNLDLRSVSLVGCEATLSYAVMRAAAIGTESINLRDFRLSWSHARSLTKQATNIAIPEQLDLPYRIVLSLVGRDGLDEGSLSGGSQKILKACQEIAQYGKILPQLWSDLIGGWNSEGIEDVAETPREERVVRVRRLLESLAAQSKGDLSVRAFLGGYLVNQIGPGSFEHYALLVSVLDLLPGVLLWYGLCAGLRRKSFLRNLSGSLGRRVLRDALRPESILDQPTCEISLAELEIVSAAGDYKGQMRFASHGYASVEIAPCVNTLVRVPQLNVVESGKTKTAALSQETLFDNQSDDTSERNRATAELRAVLVDIDKLRGRIAKYVTPPESKRGKRKGRP